MKISTKQKEFFRFCLVGGTATGIHYGIYLLLNRVMNTNVAFSIGYFVSFLANFVLSNFFTFKTRPFIVRIDHILYGSAFRAISCEVDKTASESDHHPIEAVLTLSPAQE